MPCRRHVKVLVGVLNRLASRTWSQPGAKLTPTELEQLRKERDQATREVESCADCHQLWQEVT